MAFYPKRLNNLRELEQEKLALEKQLQKLEGDDLFSLKDLKSSGKNKKADVPEEGGLLGNLMDMLPVDNPLMELAISFAKKRFSRPAATRAKVAAGNAEPSLLQKGKTLAKTAAVEVITGYLKWKAIELTYKGVTYLVKKRREERILRKMEEDAVA
jgi:hypothetical protein